ncbi:MAG: ribulose-phosphate 3-epimerase, partial [Firmicutes bacterium]|nr:ribulose-phosphate 3-epimerase [Bacillota bacterium]
RKERGLDYVIEIDGGVNLNNAAEIKEAGCDILVAGSAVFGAQDIPERVREFQAILR